MKQLLTPIVSGLTVAVGSRAIDVYEEILSYEDDKQFAKDFTEFTGIRTRRVLGDGETLLGLATQAALAARKGRGGPSCIIAVTQSFSPRSPGLGFHLHRSLGAPQSCPVIELNSACQGWVHAIKIIAQMDLKDALLVTADDMGTRATSSPRNVRHLFSDSVSACNVSVSNLSASAAITRVASNAVESLELDREITMDGEAISYLTQRLVPEVLKEAFKEGSMVFMHQANKQILERIAKKAHMTTHSCIETYANCTSSSIPISLADYYKNQLMDMRFKNVCGFGAGFSVDAFSIMLTDRPRFI